MKARGSAGPQWHSGPLLTNTRSISKYKTFFKATADTWARSTTALTSKQPSNPWKSNSDTLGRTDY
uniref:Uncharacterized protein n=1 Tax=Aegilops tauschii subsp. strangulata TaxID=200361 RepID=A0A453P9H6_AEGTS